MQLPPTQGTRTSLTRLTEPEESQSERLGALGIDCGAERCSALLQLASEVPASVLADMVNLAPSTAAKWVEWAGGNWVHYVATWSRSNEGGE